MTGPVVLDRIARTVTMGGRAVELTSREFSLLEHLMRSAGTVFTRAQILEQVWGYDFDPATNVVDVCIKRVRAKLQDAAVDAFKSHRWIESEKAGHDLGRAAALDWVLKYAAQWREWYNRVYEAST